MIFPSIRIEGQIFSGELLQQLDQPDTAGQRPADFGLAPDTKVKDEIASAWAAAQSYYRAFRQRVGSKEGGGTHKAARGGSGIGGKMAVPTTPHQGNQAVGVHASACPVLPPAAGSAAGGVKSKVGSGEGAPLPSGVGGAEPLHASSPSFTSDTRNLWLVPFLTLLGYKPEFARKGEEVNGKLFPISHRDDSRGSLPLHLLGWNDSLDHRAGSSEQRAANSKQDRSPVGSPAANHSPFTIHDSQSAIHHSPHPRMSPHALVQEYLNLTEHLYGLVSNGRTLRLLRDSTRLVRQSFIEFDLERMFDEDLFADFAVLFRLLHATRLPAESQAASSQTASSEGKDGQVASSQSASREGGKPTLPGYLATSLSGSLSASLSACLLEKYHQNAIDQGARIRDGLRDAVEQTLVLLGTGFLAHPANDALRARLRAATGTPDALSPRDYYHQLLRLVYRLLLLLVAEERGLLFTSSISARRRSTYLRHYSVSRFRRLAEHPYLFEKTHSDLWQGLLATFRLFEFDGPGEKLGLAPLGGHLFAPDALGPLTAAALANTDVIQVFRHLCFFSRVDGTRTAVNYGALATEEFGSVYESLLELNPVVSDTSFSFRQAAGNERKTTGSYYTPDSLVQRLLDSALDPVLDAAIAGDSPPHPPPSPQATARRAEPGRHDSPDPSLLLRTPHAPAAPADSAKAQPFSLAQQPPERLPAQAKTDMGFPRDRSLGQGSGGGATSQGCGDGIPTTTPEERILALKVCDPACGSGHFLVSAANRMARRLAVVRAGGDEPSPAEFRHALREVVSHCIYGVDINPMAVELCKVSLWLEAMEPGKPLSFLDHHIQCGNSLLGATPTLVAQGIPDAAYEPIAGDTKESARWMRNLNRDARKGQATFDFSDAKPWDRLGNLPAAMAQLDILDDDTPAAIRAKEKLYQDTVRGAGYDNARLLHDAWCAAFVWPKNSTEFGDELTTEHLRLIERNPHSVYPQLKVKIRDLARQYQFFHWHLGFPSVFPANAEAPPPHPRRGVTDSPAPSSLDSRTPQTENPSANSASREADASRDASAARHGYGFDVILGNPPWERVKLQEKEFFAERSPEIANAPNAAARKKMIADLATANPALLAEFAEAQRTAEGESHLLRDSGRYPLCGRGDINVYTVFAESIRSLLAVNGQAGIIVPSGIATDDTTKFFFQNLMDTGGLASLFDFENKGIFPAVHSSYKFCLLTMRSANRGEQADGTAAEFVFFAHAVEDLADPDRRFTLSAADIALLNPNTRTCPIFRSRDDAELTKAIYRRVPVLVRETQGIRPRENLWGIKFSTMFHMSNDAHLFRTREQLDADGWMLEGNVFHKNDKGYLPLYEGRLGHQFNHRFASQCSGELTETTGVDLSDPNRLVEPQYWVLHKEVDEHLKRREAKCQTALLGFRRVSCNTNERTSVAAIIPWGAASYGWILSFGPDSPELATLCGIYNSFCFDYLLRDSLSQPSIPQGTFEQIPGITPNNIGRTCAWGGHKPLRVSLFTIRGFLLPRVLELTYTAWDLEPFARDCGYDGPPFKWDEERRFLLRCELDAAFFHLYLTATPEGGWKPARKADGCPYDETPEQLAELQKHFPTPRDAVAYIMDTFPIVKRKDEAAHGTYRTKDTILQMYDQMQHAIATGAPYQTWLTPPPGPPCAADGHFMPMPQWDSEHWPAHIHRPKGKTS